MLTPQNGSPTRYTALKASSDFVGFVGIDAFQLEASSVVVELNLASRTGATVPLPVVDFSELNNGDGYPILTGAGTTFLDYSGRRIHASADDVLVNVSEFVY